LECLPIAADSGLVLPPKGDLYWHDPERQAAQAKGRTSPADVWQRA